MIGISLFYQFLPSSSSSLFLSFLFLGSVAIRSFAQPTTGSQRTGDNINILIHACRPLKYINFKSQAGRSLASASPAAMFSFISSPLCFYNNFMFSVHLHEIVPTALLWLLIQLRIRSSVLNITKNTLITLFIWFHSQCVRKKSLNCSPRIAAGFVCQSLTITNCHTLATSVIICHYFAYLLHFSKTFF